MTVRHHRFAALLGAAGLLTAGVSTQAVAAGPAATGRHVLLLSVDGLHQSDLTWYVAKHPTSALATLVHRGRQFTNASTPFPSDSFPGMVAQVTGGNPKSTGIYYDVSYNHALDAPGTRDCATAPHGTVVAYDESDDRDQTKLDAGQGLAGLPGSILSMTGTPQTLLNPDALPVNPTTCLPVYPHAYLKVNTIFEVARQHGLRTAWSDKHSAYDILNGPSGTGIQDLFTPEVNSDTATGDWTTDNADTRTYDTYKVNAVLNEINGYDHSGTRNVGVPAIFGMNFQSVSTAEKLPLSDGLAGGYLADGVTPGPLLSGALDYVNTEVGRLTSALHFHHLDGSTTVVLSAKHGQSPQNAATLTRIDDGAIIDALNAAWKAAGHSGADLVAAASDDDGMLVWLSDRSQAAADFASAFLRGYNGNGTAADGKAKATNAAGGAKPYTSSGLSTVYAGQAAAAFIGVNHNDPRVPDLIGIGQHGVVFTGGTKKIAEHGGNDPQDRHVPLVVAGPTVHAGKDARAVETTQIAPTILTLLKLNPNSLAAVAKEHTATLHLG
ncbi:alkaline phosphatase family protein [Acidothermaceae bacterium B102]|nr:alkaline phosphatase family protein [Acidothermaceae bacterium B102]